MLKPGPRTSMPKSMARTARGWPMISSMTGSCAVDLIFRRRGLHTRRSFETGSGLMGISYPFDKNALRANSKGESINDQCSMSNVQ